MHHQLGDEVRALDVLQRRTAQLQPALQADRVAKGADEVGLGVQGPVPEGPRSFEELGVGSPRYALSAVEGQGPEVGRRCPLAIDRGRQGIVGTPVGEGDAVHEVDVGNGLAGAVGQGDGLLQGAAPPGGVAGHRPVLRHAVVDAGAGVGRHHHVLTVALYEVGLVGGERGRDGADRLACEFDGPERTTAR